MITTPTHSFHFSLQYTLAIRLKIFQEKDPVILKLFSEDQHILIYPDQHSIQNLQPHRPAA